MCAWLYYHSVSVRSLLSLSPQGHPACVSKLCSSSLTAEQVYTQMGPTGHFSTASRLDARSRRRDNVAKPSENMLHASRWSDSCDPLCFININKLNHDLHFWAESIQTSANTNKCAESHQTSILDVHPQHNWTIFSFLEKWPHLHYLLGLLCKCVGQMFDKTVRVTRNKCNVNAVNEIRTLLWAGDVSVKGSDLINSLRKGQTERWRVVFKWLPTFIILLSLFYFISSLYLQSPTQTWLQNPPSPYLLIAVEQCSPSCLCSAPAQSFSCFSITHPFLVHKAWMLREVERGEEKAD